MNSRIFFKNWFQISIFEFLVVIKVIFIDATKVCKFFAQKFKIISEVTLIDHSVE